MKLLDGSNRYLARLICLAVGMAWSHVKRRLTGQLNVDDVED